MDNGGSRSSSTPMIIGIVGGVAPGDRFVPELGDRQRQLRQDRDGARHRSRADTGRGSSARVGERHGLEERRREVDAGGRRRGRGRVGAPRDREQPPGRRVRDDRRRRRRRQPRAVRRDDPARTTRSTTRRRGSTDIGLPGILRDYFSVSIGIGIWFCIAGGAVAIVAGVMAMVTQSSERPPTAEMPAGSIASSSAGIGCGVRHGGGRRIVDAPRGGRSGRRASGRRTSGRRASAAGREPPVAPDAAPASGVPAPEEDPPGTS